jgi:hypothetical protein
LGAQLEIVTRLGERLFENRRASRDVVDEQAKEP